MEENHPDLVAPMYPGVLYENATPLSSMMFDRTAGETHTEFLEEYLASIG